MQIIGDMNTLTAEEIAFLEKMENKRSKHNQSQAKYRAKNKDKLNEYNRNYQQKISEQKAEINKKILKADAPPPEPINIDEIAKPKKINKRTRKGKQQAQKPEIIPAYQTRKEPLTQSTIDDYLKKANILNNLFNNHNLPQQVKAELKKLLNDNTNIDKSIILNEMSFINNDIDNTINTLRQSYTNNNSFKTYINILAVITSHFRELQKEHIIYSKLGKELNKGVEALRALNELSEGDEDKIIEVGEQAFKNNVDKLDKIDDILLYGLYLLFPARRLDYRHMRITTEKDINKLNETNYLKIDGNNKQFVFNDYKTYSTYKKQVFEVPKTLNDILNRYINIKGLKNDDYLFSLTRDKREPISQGNFTNKIKDTFEKVYGILHITVRFLRMSWATDLYNKNPTVKDINELAYKMSHSADESRLYNKIKKV